MIEKKPAKKVVNQKNSYTKTKIIDDKLKPLMPTLRQKKRFILVKIESSKKFEFKEISENLVDEIIIYLGAIEFGKAGIWILRDKFDEKNQEFIMKVSIQTKDKLCAVLSLVNKIGKDKIKFNIVNISGTIKGLKRKGLK